jgi:hypothetical protein
VLAFKAEVVLAVQLITRHRAPRLAMFLAVSLVVMLLAADPASASLNSLRRTLALIGGALSAVGASRLFAQGGALASVRQTASPWLQPAAGRLAGLLALIALGLFGASSVVLGVRWGVGEAVRSGAMLLVYCGGVAASVMALTPVVGASSAAALGLVAAMLGGVLPSEVATLLEGWPMLRGPAVLSWNVLPLSWRAERWLSTGDVTDPLVLLGWAAFGIVVTGYLAGSANHPGSSESRR